MANIMNPLEPGSESEDVAQHPQGQASSAALALDWGAPLVEGAGVRPLRKDPRLWGIVAFALLLGLMVSLPHLHQATPPVGDEVDYHTLGRTMLEGGHYENTYRAPVYPAFIALVYWVCGPHPFAVYAAQCFLFAFSLPIVARVLEQISLSRSVGLMTAALAACYPVYYLQMVHRMMSEALSLFLVSLFLAVLYSALRCGVWWKGAVLGALFAAATLTKAILLPFAGITAICLFLLARDRRSGAWQTVLFLVFAGLCIGPWTYRNWRLTGAFLPVSTGAGLNLWLGNYPGNYDERLRGPGRADEWPHLPLDLEAAVQGMNELQRDGYLKRVALNYIREDPGRAARIFLLKFSFLWLDGLGRDPEMFETKPHFAVGRFTIPRTAPVKIPLFVLAMAGVWMLKNGQRARSLPVLLLLGWWTAIYVAMVADFRYALPVWPYVFGFVAIALLALARRFSQGRRQAGPAPAGREYW
jgi:hypothetical protein